MTTLKLSIPNSDTHLSHSLISSFYKSIKKSRSSISSSERKKPAKKSKKTPSLQVVKSIIGKRNIEKKIKMLASDKLLTCENIKQIPNMEFVGEGVANKVFFGCLDLKCEEKAAFRIMPISKSYPLNSKHPVNVELKLYQQFNKLNALYILPHLPLMIKNFRCSYSQVISDEEVLEEYEEKIETNEIDKKVNVMVLEYCRGGSIKEFVDKYQKNIKYLRCGFFQVLLSLIVLQYHLKHFRHNDLHNNNVNLDLFGFMNEDRYLKTFKKKPCYIAYKIFGTYFYVPYLGFCMKLIDFDVSCSLKTPNSKVKIDKIYKKNGVSCKPNPVFDTHLILNSCTYKFFEKFMGLSTRSQTLHSEMISFIDRNIPSELRGFNTDKLGFARIKEIKKIPKGLKTPISVITEDSLFAEYMEKPTDGKVIMVYDTKIPPLKKIRESRKDMFIN